MQTQTQPTREDILALVATMTREQLALLYDVATAIRQRVITPAPELADDDPLGATEEEMAAEDAMWEATTAKHADKLDSLSQRIREHETAGRMTHIVVKGEELVQG